MTIQSVKLLGNIN